MKQIEILWKAVKNINKKLDTIEDEVAHVVAPLPAESRETPFIFTEKFVFDPSAPNFEISEQSLVSSAGVATKITRLTYSVALRYEALENVPPLTSRGPFERLLRPSARGMILGNWTRSNLVGVGNSTEDQICLFDFEWNLSIGSTEREYAKTFGDLFRGFCSREALSNTDQSDSLVIGEDHPLIIGSNQFLTFKVRPTLFNFFFAPNPEVPNFTATNPEIVLTISGVGYRSLSDV